MSHRVRGLVAAQCTGEIILDFLLGVTAVLIAELHADAGGALALRTLGGHPDHPTGDRQFLFFAHQIQQHEHFVAQTIIAVRRNEQAAVLYERHIGEIQRALILDRKRQQTRFITWTSQFLPFPRKALVRQRGPTTEQQGLQRQLLIHAGRCKTPQLTGGIQQLE
jgi:hypothetical protein